MCEGWLETLLGWPCGAFGALQFAAGCWVFFELQRKWRSIPELWGLDWLDIVFRVESEFGVTLTAVDFENQSSAARIAMTGGQLWHLVEAKLRAAGRDVPSDGWNRLVVQFAGALSVKKGRITTESRLYADLGMTSGI